MSYASAQVQEEARMLFLEKKRFERLGYVATGVKPNSAAVAKELERLETEDAAKYNGSFCVPSLLHPRLTRAELLQSA